MKRNILFFLFLYVFFPFHADSQERLDEQLMLFDFSIVEEERGAIALTLDNLSFFKDNEYSSNHAFGYTLPGFWIQPRVSYQPLKNLRLEAGFHALVYAGANKYPCYAYHDVATWKGEQYQRGAHVLPFFRVQAQMGRWTLVLGDLYGAGNHKLSEPLLNPELNLTQDPEMGVQLFLRRQHFQFEAWCDWQSYIFEDDGHQEAFTVGVSQRILLNSPDSPLHMYIPADLLAQHRGGEQDTTSLGVQTLVNGAVGLGLKWNSNRKVLKNMNAELLALGAWQQNGRLWPFDTGYAAYASLSFSLRGGFRVFGSLLYGKDFVSLYGVPFFNTLSQKPGGGRFQSTLAPHVGIEWHRAFAKDYQLGVKIDAYPVRSGKFTYSEADPSTNAMRQVVLPAAFDNNFSFGVYFRCTPRFILRKAN
ncbi:MAG: hypothetical protein K6F94_08740 [Bacteroidaceae bacterium]|nr:hypothetical protein [Bacteroidaceae bacterium]